MRKTKAPFVYIGSAFAEFGESIWHNPFKIELGCGRKCVLEKYEAYVRSRPHLKDTGVQVEWTKGHNQVRTGPHLIVLLSLEGMVGTLLAFRILRELPKLVPRERGTL